MFLDEESNVIATRIIFDSGDIFKLLVEIVRKKTLVVP